jgi:hypothetical protein
LRPYVTSWRKRPLLATSPSTGVPRPLAAQASASAGPVFRLSPSPRRRRQRSFRWVGKNQSAAQLVHKLPHQRPDLNEALTHSPEPPVTGYSGRHSILVCGRDVHLPNATRVSRAQVLRGVLGSCRAVTARIAAPTRTAPEATSDERPLFIQKTPDLLVVLLRGLLQALAQTAGSLGHGVSIRLAGTLINKINMPAHRVPAHLGNALCNRQQSDPLAQEPSAGSPLSAEAVGPAADEAQLHRHHAQGVRQAAQAGVVSAHQVPPRLKGASFGVLFLSGGGLDPAEPPPPESRRGLGSGRGRRRR